mgnify:CR=1 FL=1
MNDSRPPSSLREISTMLEHIEREVKRTGEAVSERGEKIDEVLLKMEGTMSGLRNTFQTALEGNHQLHAKTHRDLDSLTQQIGERDEEMLEVNTEIRSEMKAIRAILTRKTADGKPRGR